MDRKWVDSEGMSRESLVKRSVHVMCSRQTKSYELCEDVQRQAASICNPQVKSDDGWFELTLFLWLQWRVCDQCDLDLLKGGSQKYEPIWNKRADGINCVPVYLYILLESTSMLRCYRMWPQILFLGQQQLPRWCNLRFPRTQIAHDPTMLSFK